MTTTDFFTLNPLPASTRLYAANARFVGRTLQLGITVQQAFAQEALRLWSEFLAPPIHPVPADTGTPFSTTAAGLACDAAQRSLRFAGGMSAAAAAAAANGNNELQEPIAEWQKACPPGTMTPPWGLDPASAQTQRGGTPA